MTTIPISMDVNIIPGVLSAGGRGLVLNGMFLTDNERPPIGGVVSFANAQSVSAYFGADSNEYAKAQKYFSGYDNSFIKPARLYFAQYPTAAVAAFLRGGKVTALSIPQLAALSGSLTVVIDGFYTWTASSIDLSGTTSYSDAADTIETALTASPPQGASCTSGTIAGTVLTVAGTVTGTFRVGQRIAGTSVTAGSKIVSLGTGTGAAGTYNLSASSTVGVGETITAFGATPTVTFDSTSGAFVITSTNLGSPVSAMAFATGTIAAPIFLTQATGAVISQGANIAVPGTFMDALVSTTQNWATFMTLFDPDNGSGNDQKLAFAEWNTEQNNRWNYVCWDTDASPAVTVPASSSLGQLLMQSDISGTTLVWNTAEVAAFYCGAAASIDFTRTNGRATLKFKSQSGLTPTVTDQTTAQNLIDNGYNFYGAFATANDFFNYFSPGSVSGIFEWADSYLNQVWLNASLQLAMISLLTTVGAVPYTVTGYNLIESAMADPVQAGVNFGAFSPGVPLSQAQQTEINFEAGVDIIVPLFTQGYYIQVKAASAITRQARGSPPITLWYTDAGAVQKITIASIAVQ